MVPYDPSNPEDNVRVPKDDHGKNSRTLTIGLIITCCVATALFFIGQYASIAIDVEDLLISLEYDDGSESKKIQQILDSKTKLRDFFGLFAVLFMIPAVSSVILVIAIDRIERKTLLYANLWRGLYTCLAFTGIFAVSSVIVLTVNQIIF